MMTDLELLLSGTVSHFKLFAKPRGLPPNRGMLNRKHTRETCEKMSASHSRLEIEFQGRKFTSWRALAKHLGVSGQVLYSWRTRPKTQRPDAKRKFWSFIQLGENQWRVENQSV